MRSRLGLLAPPKKRRNIKKKSAASLRSLGRRERLGGCRPARRRDKRKTGRQRQQQHCNRELRARQRTHRFAWVVSPSQVHAESDAGPLRFWMLWLGVATGSTRLLWSRTGRLKPSRHRPCSCSPVSMRCSMGMEGLEKGGGGIPRGKRS